MEKKKRECGELLNTFNIPLYTGALITCEHKIVFYKKLYNYVFYTIDNLIVFRVNDEKPLFIVVGEISVSSNEILLKSFVNVMSFLGYEVPLQNELFLFDDRGNIIS